MIMIVVLLAAIAVPSYASFGGRASTAVAQANVRMAIPVAESYFNDPAAGNNSFRGITGGKLRLQAPGLDLSLHAGPNGSEQADGPLVRDRHRPLPARHVRRGGLEGKTHHKATS